MGEVTLEIVKYATGGPGEAFVAGGAGGVEQVAGDLGLVVEHLLEVGHEPAGIDGVAMEAAAEVVVQAALDHVAQGFGGESQGFASGLGGATALERGDAEQEVDIAGARKFRCAAEAAVGGVEALVEVGETAFEGIAGRFVQGGWRGGRGRGGGRGRAGAAGVGDGGGAVGVVVAQRGEHAVGLGDEIGAFVPPGTGDGGEQAGEAAPALTVLGREVGAAEEGLQVGGKKDVERPAARAGAGLDVGHVDAVDVGAFLAVEFHRDEIAIELGGDGHVLEGFAGHDVAPVAGRVADGEEDGLILGAGAGEGGFAPFQPSDGVVGVLAQVGGLGVGEGVGHGQVVMAARSP